MTGAMTSIAGSFGSTFTAFSNVYIATSGVEYIAHKARTLVIEVWPGGGSGGAGHTSIACGSTYGGGGGAGSHSTRTLALSPSDWGKTLNFSAGLPGHYISADPTHGTGGPSNVTSGTYTLTTINTNGGIEGGFEGGAGSGGSVGSGGDVNVSGNNGGAGGGDTFILDGGIGSNTTIATATIPITGLVSKTLRGYVAQVVFNISTTNPPIVGTNYFVDNVVSTGNTFNGIYQVIDSNTANVTLYYVSDPSNFFPPAPGTYVSGGDLKFLSAGSGGPGSSGSLAGNPGQPGLIKFNYF